MMRWGAARQSNTSGRSHVGYGMETCLYMNGDTKLQKYNQMKKENPFRKSRLKTLPLGYLKKELLFLQLRYKKVNNIPLCPTTWVPPSKCTTNKETRHGTVHMDIYGKVLAIDKGTEFDCPFRYQGQYVDKETKLCYNRFRYYEPEIGNYISQDPIGLSAGERFYSYVKNVNLCIDIFGLVAKEFDIDTYGNISSRANIGDNLTAHELLQHAWLEQNNKLPTSKN